MGRVAGGPGTEEQANSLGEFAGVLLQNGLKVADLDSPASEADLLPSHREDTSEPRESRSATWRPFYKPKRANSPRELMPLSTPWPPKSARTLSENSLVLPYRMASRLPISTPWPPRWLGRPLDPGDEKRLGRR